MSSSMYASSIPVFERMLGATSEILRKAEADAEARGIDQAVLLNSRLAPDMFPLVRQVQIATDMAKGCCSRLAGLEVPKWEDNETSFAELRERIERGLAHMRALVPDQLNGSEDRDIELLIGGQAMQFKGLPYLHFFVLPNFYFHLSMTYAILRHNGLQIGKRDFLGAI
ncbi:MAG: DUF1993 domain-containing protein [Xanthomonadales bacterium]|nr:DUF1993 domain-containing protein [Xanthomonadales bacterium]